ncbi:hypothetical protein AB6A40_009737 [Gnathostoma spinigerum]|uniref:TAFH domain-containing protein n=1 Tax=Gnathostoma spinigerum TaxID=75299 RepID=A0ABD6ET81_9BILA
MTTSMSAPSFQNHSIKPEVVTTNSPQMIVSNAPTRQPVQYVVINQSGVPIADVNGGIVGHVSVAQPQAPPQQIQQIQPQQQQQAQQQQQQPQQQQQHQQQPPQQQQPHQSQLNPTRVNPVEQANMVTKCARFFKTLIHLSQQPDQQQGQQTAVKVTELVKLVIYGSMPPEVFTSRLQEALRSQAQPHLLPFLQKTLPALRAALQKGEVVIEGIGAPTPPQPIETPQTTHWELTTVQPNNENVYQQTQTQPVAVQQVIVASQTPTTSTPVKSVETSEESQMEMSDSAGGEGEVRPLPPNELFYRILNGDVISRKIQKAMPDGGPAHDEVITMISRAAEYRLRNILAHLAVIAEHRLEPLRNNPLYQVIDDTRRQLRFVEELDRQEQERRENREKEALIRLSKSKGKDKDTLVEKAKQMQRADQEAARNRDANAAAIAALGGSKGVKRSWTEAANPFEQPISSGLSTQIHRPRTKRVTMRDLQFVISSDPVAKCSPLRHRLSLFNSPADAVAS